MSKKFILIMVLTVLVTMCIGCTTNTAVGGKADPKNISNNEGNNKQDDTKSEAKAILVKNTVVEVKDFSFKFLEFDLVKSVKDNGQDALNIYDRTFGAKVDSAALGYDIGFNNSKSEVDKRDAYLVLVLDYNWNKKITSQRDSIIPEMKLKAIDNKGDDVILMHNSIHDKYIDVENPKGVLVFKTFSDTTSVTFEFDGNPYNLQLNK
ncbi:hypothetical protein ACER0A_000685 [Haloimpatiens sp. FM7315]|uniref:hypothetical protein n=1 Tax=Haloimpatiens sp. FM7315 TaxID=3298609 RepID=UPI0035A332FD